MKPSRNALPATLLALVFHASASILVASTAVGQDLGAADERMQPTDSVLTEDRHSTLYYTEHTDGTWVRGRTYKAQINDRGFTYIPFLGSDAPRNYPVQFRLTSVLLGGVELKLAARASVTLESDRFTLNRGPVDVLYDMALESVEQSFELDVAGHEGDLVIELDVISDLIGSKAGAGLAFRGPNGGVDYGAAIVFDGAGHRADVPMTFDGSQLRLTVPASFMGQAIGPVTVDPIFSTYSVDEYTAELDNVDVGFDSSSRRNTYVYEERFSGADSDLFSISYETLDGTMLTSGYIDGSTDSWVRPKIANIDVLDQSLIVAEKINSIGVHSIVGRFYDDATGFPTTAITIATPPAGVYYRYPDVGGDNNSTATSPHFLVGWSESNIIAAPIATRLRTVSPTGTLGSITVLAGSGTTTSWGLVISKGNSSLFGLNAWNIAFAYRSAPGANAQIGTGEVNANGILVTNGIIYTVAAGVLPYDLDVSESIYAGGTSPKHLISYDETNEVDRSTKRILFLRGTSLVRAFDLNQMEHGPIDRPVHGIRLATTWTPPIRPEFVVAYHQEDADGTTGIYLTTLDSRGSSTLAISEHRTRVATSNPYSLFGNSLALASRASGGYHSKFSMVAWSRYNPISNSNDIYGATHLASMADAAGQQFCEGVPNSTGERGFLACYGNSSSTTIQTLYASKLPPNTLALYIAGQGNTDIHQPGGSLGVLCIAGAAFGRYTDQAVFTGTAGIANLAIDPAWIPDPFGTTAALAGQHWNFQLWHRDVVGGNSVSNFTNAVRLIFE